MQIADDYMKNSAQKNCVEFEHQEILFLHAGMNHLIGLWQRRLNTCIFCTREYVLHSSGNNRVLSIPNLNSLIPTSI